MPLWGLTKGLIDKAVQRVKQQLGWGDPHEADEPHDPRRDPALEGPATSLHIIEYRIQVAARKRVKLNMFYNNTWRKVEPYSYRGTAQGFKAKVLYGWCDLHDTIEAYYLQPIEDHTGIQDVHVTDVPFTPRFEIESPPG